MDADVFSYARRFRKRELEAVLTQRDIIEALKDGDDSASITLSGKTSVSRLQTLLSDLNRSLRTQDVPLKDLSHTGRALLAEIKKSENVSGLTFTFICLDKLYRSYLSTDSLDGDFLLLQRLLVLCDTSAVVTMRA